MDMASESVPTNGAHSSCGTMSHGHTIGLDKVSVPDTPTNVSFTSSILNTSASQPIDNDTVDTGPLPNPPFVFPARSPSASPYTRGRSIGSRSAFDTSSARNSLPDLTRRFGPSALPAFSFNSSTNVVQPQPATNESSSSLNGSLNDISSIPNDAVGRRTGAPAHPHNGGVASLLDPTAPAKTVTSSAGRRGHAHRRSAAISCHDLSIMLTPPTLLTVPRGGSAPSTPSAQDVDTLTFPTTPRHALTTSISDPNTSLRMPDVSLRGQSAQTPKGRVGFSDTLEFIPRPLSLVSSDTSSTITMRPGGHSVSDSLSSVLSVGPSSLAVEPDHASNRNSASIESTNHGLAILTLEKPTTPTTTQLRRRNSVPPLSESGVSSTTVANTPKTSKKYIFFGSSEPVDQPRNSPRLGSSGSDRRSLSAPPTPDMDVGSRTFQALSSVNTAQPKRSSSLRKSSKQQKKVKSWAGSILSRKTRPRSKSKTMNRRSPTPPLSVHAPAETRLSPDDFTMNTETRSIIALDLEKTSSLPSTNDFNSWKPRALQIDDDASMPIIDLDAALSPFSTPSTPSFDPEWEASQGGARMKRRMHSGGPTRSFRSNDMGIHRRTESAPEMERFNLNRLGSSSTMADVFEEEEEEDWEDTRSVSHKSSKTQIDESLIEEKLDAVVVDDSKAQSVVDQGSVSGTDAIVSTERQMSSDSAMLVKDDEHTTLGKTATDTGLEPPPQLLLTPVSPSSTFQSPLPSPRSTLSYDVHRMSSTPSSINDDRAHESLQFGEPGPELRMSVDDVPSLSSSDSTTTRDSLVNPAYSSPQSQPRHNQHSASMSESTTARKRSSIASFTRLLHTSNGEKSPLSMESRAPSLAEVRDRSPKSKRFSRLMNFWKPREPAT